MHSNMADESDKIEVVDVPVPFPPPPLPAVLFKERRNFMKCPASLIGKENGTNVKRSALDLCRSFVCSRAERTPDTRKLSWFCCNNDVEAFLQDGPTCGLIALKLAADILKTSGPLKTPLPTTGEDEIARLLQLSKESGFTYCGEMFSARDMVSLARQYYGLNYEVGSSGLEDYVKLVNHIVEGYPVLVPYDADKNHEPCLKRGHKAHWAVITGCLLGLDDTETETQTRIDSYEEIPVYPLKDGKSSLPSSFGSKDLFLIVRHGQSRHSSLWPWLDLYKSNNNLFEFNPVELQDIEKSDGRRCIFTEGVLQGLCSKALFYCPS